ncbi:MAG: hypothetical protein JHC61_06090 [Burkholderiaceae bacterium]|nr:hypothetical protein [Burkholderiaceae bacterium]
MRTCFVLVSAILFISQGVSLATPPSLVYRVDTRPPDEIFVHGFRAWGNDHNIVAHVNGHTCTGAARTSAFVSTMASFHMVDELVASHLRERATTYVYSIRADSNFYSAPATVDYFQSYNPLAPLSLNSLRMSRRVQEWVAVDRIPPQNISSVVARHRNGVNTFWMNPMYQDRQTQGSSQFYLDHAEDTLQHYRFPLNRPNQTTLWISACFSVCDTPIPSYYYAEGSIISLAAPQCVEQKVYRVEDALAVIFSL